LLFDKKPSRRTLYAFARVAVFLMAIGIGALGTGVAIATLENRQLASDASR
jgi:multisubunit Na+/H+ antiporter MnhB subunit